MPIEIEQKPPERGEQVRPHAAMKDGEIAVGLLTGGGDKPYVYGLAMELTSKGATLDLIGSNDLDCPEYQSNPRVNFLNLRGHQDAKVGFRSKVVRIIAYYSKLIRYAATAKPKILHILWNNKFLHFDRTLLTYYYKLLGKRIVLTVHNVNAGKRDNNDTALNRLTLRIQYGLSDHLFVHTEKMKQELMEEFGVQPARISVIPFGINNAVPCTDLTPGEAKQRLGLLEREKAILFFGNIAPYKGLEYLVTALQQVLSRDEDYRLIIAGCPKNCDRYWNSIQQAIAAHVRERRILVKAVYIPDEETEIYFKAADVLVLPYRDIYQSGILFLGYSFGLPALVADVGSLKEEIVEGATGYVFKPQDPIDLAVAVEKYFASDLYKDLGRRREQIRDYAARKNNWDAIGRTTLDIYSGLL